VTSTVSNASRQIARAAGTVMFALALSMLIGLFRRVLMADAFGTSLEIEAFAAANRVSETLFNLVAGGALASAFIPTYTTLLTKNEISGAWKLASAVGNLITIVVIVASIIAAIFAPAIVRYFLAPGFGDNPYKEQLTISLLRLMLPSAVIFSVSGLIMGILNSHQKFFIPALAPSMYSVGMIMGILFLAPRSGIYGLAWGVLLGSALHLAIQIPTLIRLGGRYVASLGLDFPPVRETFRLMIPRLIGVGIVQINFWVNVWLASFMVEGSVNGLNFAFAIMLMPQSIIAQSIAIAAMPTFSAQVAKNQIGEMRKSLVDSLRWVLLFTIPATIGLVVFRTELVEIIYERGEFTQFSTILVAWALLWYGLGLVPHSVVEIVSRAFYSLHDTKTPVAVGIAAMTLNVIFSLIFVKLFEVLGLLQLGGLAAANSLATGLEMILLLIIMRGRLRGLEGKSISIILAQSGVASLVMFIALQGWILLGTKLPVWLMVVIGIFIGAVTYGLVLYLIRNSETRSLVTRIKRIHL